MRQTNRIHVKLEIKLLWKEVWVEELRREPCHLKESKKPILVRSMRLQIALM